MLTRELRHAGRRVVVAVLDKGDEALAGITEAARRHGLDAAQLTAVGAMAHAEVGYFDREKRDYDHIPVPEQVEVLSLLGDVADKDGTPVVHAHAVLGRRDGSVVGGHLLAGEVWPTLEVILTEVAPQLAKSVDPETGLALIDLKAQA
jgi:uncharacterized protein